MLKKYAVPPSPLETTLVLIGDKTKPLIINHLLSGPKRPSELSKLITTISPKMLTQHLKIMEETKLLTRHIFPGTPAHVEYELTEIGQNLACVLKAMYDWGAYYQSKYTEK